MKICNVLWLRPAFDFARDLVSGRIQAEISDKRSAQKSPAAFRDNRHLEALARYPRLLIALLFFY
ncbi:hypothetical protein ARTHROSP310_03260 [Arthrobacter sp. AD-310]